MIADAMIVETTERLVGGRVTAIAFLKKLYSLVKTIAPRAV